MGRPKGSKNKVKGSTVSVKRGRKPVKQVAAKRTRIAKAPQARSGITELALAVATMSTQYGNVLVRLSALEQVYVTMGEKVNEVNDGFNLRITACEQALNNLVAYIQQRTGAVSQVAATPPGALQGSNGSDSHENDSTAA